MGLQRVDFVLKQVLIDFLRTGLQFRNFFVESRLNTTSATHAWHTQLSALGSDTLSRITPGSFLSSNLETHSRSLSQLSKSFVSVLRLNSLASFTTMPPVFMPSTLRLLSSGSSVGSASSSQFLTNYSSLVVGSLPASSWGKFFANCVGGGSAQSTALFSDLAAVRAFEHTYASLLLNQRDIFRSSSIENTASWYNRRYSFQVNTLQTGLYAYATWSPLAALQNTATTPALRSQEASEGVSILWRSSGSDGVYYGLATSGVSYCNPLNYSGDLQTVGTLRDTFGSADVLSC